MTTQMVYMYHIIVKGKDKGKGVGLLSCIT